MSNRSATILGLILLLALSGALSLAACGEGTFEQDGDAFEEQEIVSELNASQRRQRLTLIRDAAQGAGLTNAVILAGVANSETNLAHCWSEARWACQGPASSSCGGGPVIAGAGDGPCHLQEGGLGLFQFDAGTYSQTLARDGRDILTVEGNTRRGVEFVVDMVIRSQYISGVSNRAQALAWMNTVRIDSTNWDAWIKTVVHYYNGCIPGRCSVYNQRYGKYSEDTRIIYRELGQAFWYAPVAPPRAPIEVYWARTADGSYDLRALTDPKVVKVRYEVDGYLVAEGTRAEGANFPKNYNFSLERAERKLVVRGFDSRNEEIARGIGLLDVTAGTGVYIKQMGAGLYEVGLERAPAAVASISVQVDDQWTLTDSVSGAQRSSRQAVRSTFGELGERRFKISTYGADGALRGNLTRTFTLE